MSIQYSEPFKLLLLNALNRCLFQAPLPTFKNEQTTLKKMEKTSDLKQTVWFPNSNRPSNGNKQKNGLKHTSVGILLLCFVFLFKTQLLPLLVSTLPRPKKIIKVDGSNSKTLSLVVGMLGWKNWRSPFYTTRPGVHDHSLRWLEWRHPPCLIGNIYISIPSWVHFPPQ